MIKNAQIWIFSGDPKIPQMRTKSAFFISKPLVWILGVFNFKILREKGLNRLQIRLLLVEKIWFLHKMVRNLFAQSGGQLEFGIYQVSGVCLKTVIYSVDGITSLYNIDCPWIKFSYVSKFSHSPHQLDWLVVGFVLSYVQMYSSIYKLYTRYCLKCT